LRTNSSAITLAGWVSDPTAVVMVQNAAAVMSGTNWVATGISLAQEGENLIAISATTSTGAKTQEHLNVTKDTLVPKPLGLIAVSISSDTNRLVWLPSGGSIVRTTISRVPSSGGTAAQIGSVLAPVTTFDDTNFPTGTNFCYKIQAVDDLGNLSPFSDEACPKQFGSGGAGDLSETGGSIDSASQTSSAVSPTVLAPPTPIQETNGSIRVRYVPTTDNAFPDYLSRYGLDVNPYASVEWAGPMPLHWEPATMTPIVSLGAILVENTGGFGATLTVSITAPPGFIFDSNPRPQMFGRYPQYGPQFRAPTSGDSRVPDWNQTQSLTGMPDTLQLNSYTATSNQVTFSVTSTGVQIDTDSMLNPVMSGPGNIMAFQIPGFLRALDPMTFAVDRAPRLRMTVNGATAEAGLYLLLDADPSARPALLRSIDDAGGSVNLFTGDYSFQVPLFQGQGAGINLQGLLSYSSVNGSWDLAALQQSHPHDYSSMPLGPGWGYPYGMRILRRDLTLWAHGAATHTNDVLLLVCPDGRVTQWWYDPPTQQFFSLQVLQSFWNPAIIHPPTPSWAQFFGPVIVETPMGYALRESDQNDDGFQEIDFDTQGRMTAIIPQGGVQPVSIQYVGSVQKVTDSSGRTAEFSFDSSGRMLEITDPAGGDWKLNYCQGGALISATEASTGYGWEFAYDNTQCLLTERKLPHGFIIQASYDTGPDSSGRFFWGALTSTAWKESPATSTRTVTYERNNVDTSTTVPSRVSISSPSGRNTTYYDLPNAFLLAEHFAFGMVASVRVSDHVEGDPKALRYIGTDISSFQFYSVGNLQWEFHTNAMGDTVIQSFYGPYPDYITREDGNLHSWDRSSPNLTVQSASGEANWRWYVTNRYAYFDPKTPKERLMAVFPPGQDPANPASHQITFGYDGSYRLQSVTDLDSNVTQMVYYTAPGKLGLPYEIIPLYNLVPLTTTGLTNPYAWTFDYDGLGRATFVKDPNQNVTQYFYDGAGRLTRILGPTNASGNFVAPETDFSYQGDLLIRSTSQGSDGQNQTTTHVYDSQRRLLAVNNPGNDPSGSPSSTTYAYDADGNVTNVVSPNKGMTSNVYDNRGRLTRSVGPSGEVTEFDYDDATDEVAEKRKIDGTEIRKWTVISRDKLRRLTDLQLPTVPQGGVTGRPELSYGYDADGNITNQTYSFGGQSASVASDFGLFDETRRIITDLGGGQAAVQQFVTDYEGRTIQQQGMSLVANGSAGIPYVQSQTNRTRPTVANLTYSPFSTISGIWDLAGNERVNFGLDSVGLLKQIKIPNPAVPQLGSGARADTFATSLERDNFNLPNNSSDVFGNTTSFSRDRLGRVQSTTDPSGAQVKTSWSSAGDPAATTTTAGAVTMDTTRVTHDDLGNTTGIIAPGNNGGGTTFQYDLSGRVTNRTDAAGNATTYQYNGFGELVKQTYPSGASITYARNAFGRVTSSTEYATNGTAARTETTQYDWHGHASSVEDANYRIEYDSDNLGRMLAKRTIFKSLSITNEMTYRYGEYGNLVSEQDNDGYLTKYLWDDDDNLISVELVPPGGDAQQVILHSDAAGQVLGWECQSGSNTVVSATFNRDEKGRLRQLSYSDFGTSATPLPTIAYSYDNRDQVTKIVDFSKNLFAELGYDPRGYLSSETWSQLSDGTPIYQDQIGYDAAGNRAWRQLNGNLTTYSYASDFSLIARDEQTLVRVPNALIKTLADSTNGPGFDSSLANDQLAPDSEAPGTGWRSDTNSVGHWLELDLDAVHPISVVEVSTPTDRGGLSDFQIETADSSTPFHTLLPYQILQGYRVSTNAVGTRSHTVRVTFAWPQLASKVRIFVPAGGTARNPFTQAQLPDVVINEVALYEITESSVSLSYDGNGRLINDGKFTYAYDVQGHLTGIKGAGVDKTWTITPEGLRGSEQDNLSGETRYFANNGQNAYLEFTATGKTPTPKLRYFNGFGADDHLGFFEYAADGTGEFRWPLSQGLGSITQVLDTKGKVLDDRVYTAWGEDLINPKRTSANLYGFAGARQDPQSGLYYNRARMYDPHIGRFLAKDPLGMINGPNVFVYAGNDPIMRSDPSGLDYRDWFGLDGRDSTLWAAYKGYWEGFGTGALTLGDALTFRAISPLHNEVTRQQQDIFSPSGMKAYNALADVTAVTVYAAAGGVVSANAAEASVARNLAAQNARWLALGGEAGEAYVAGPLSRVFVTGMGLNGAVAGGGVSATLLGVSGGRLVEAGNAFAATLGALSGPGLPRGEVKPLDTARHEILADLFRTLDPERILDRDPDALVGLRGSLVRGSKGEHKGNAPFDPGDFDVDAFIISDRLAAQFPRKVGNQKVRFRDAGRLGRVDDPGSFYNYQKDVEAMLRKLPNFRGLRADPFTFLVRTHDEAEKQLNEGDLQMYFGQGDSE
jgi:RHS repeat-associated protein